MNESSEKRSEPPQPDAVAGTFITETFDYDEGRQVTVYLPRAAPQAIVFAADGQMISQWGPCLEAAHLPSTMIVGVHRQAGETLRLHEYSPNFDPNTARSSQPPPAEGTGRLTQCRALSPVRILWPVRWNPFFLQNAALWAAALRNANPRHRDRGDRAIRDARPSQRLPILRTSSS